MSIVTAFIVIPLLGVAAIELEVIESDFRYRRKVHKRALDAMRR